MSEFELKLDDPDEFYEALLLAHEGLSEDQSHDLNQAMVYVFANWIGSVSLLKVLIHETRQALIS